MFFFLPKNQNFWCILISRFSSKCIFRGILIWPFFELDRETAKFSCNKVYWITRKHFPCPLPYYCSINLPCEIWSGYDKYHNNLKYHQKCFSVCILSTTIKYYVKSRSFCYSTVGPEVVYYKLFLLIGKLNFCDITCNISFWVPGSRGYYWDVNLQRFQPETFEIFTYASDVSDCILLNPFRFTGGSMFIHNSTRCF